MKTLLISALFASALPAAIWAVLSKRWIYIPPIIGIGILAVTIKYA